MSSNFFSRPSFPTLSSEERVWDGFVLARYRMPPFELPERSGRANRARYVGNQPSMGMEWEINPHVTFNANYTYFFAGDFLKGNSSRNLNYLMLQMTYKF